MALLIDDKYIKLETDGTYTIYKSKTSRNRIKKTTTPEEVLNKYYEKLDEISSADYFYYTPNAEDELFAWKVELNLYYLNLTNGTYGADYPLMKQYIPDVNKTIPEIVENGRMGYLAARVNSLDELYELVKDLEIFGPKDKTIDI